MCCVSVQRHCRTFLLQQSYRQRLKHVIVLQAGVRRIIAEKHYRRMKLEVRLRCDWCAVIYALECEWGTVCNLTPSAPAVPNCCCSKGPVPYWSNLPFLIFDIWALWRSVLSARAPKCQKLKMVGLTSMANPSNRGNLEQQWDRWWKG